MKSLYLRASYFVSSACQMQMESRFRMVLVDSKYPILCVSSVGDYSSCLAPGHLMQKSFVKEKLKAGGPMS